MRANITIFLNNKLVSCDTILPVMFELDRLQPNHRIEFVCFDQKTIDAIRDNFVLMEGIERIGTFHKFVRSKPGLATKFIHRMRVAGFLLRLALMSIFGRCVFIHFKALNSWPLKIMYHLNRKRTLFCQPTAAGYTKSERAVSGLIVPRSENVEVPAASALLYFNDDWLFLEPGVSDGIPRYRLPNPYQLKGWCNYIDSRADGDLNKALNSSLDDTRPVIGFLLGWFGEMGFLADPHAVRSLFEEALDVLIEEGKGCLIALKPHAITDMKIVEDIIKKPRDASIIVTHAHPSVLASRAAVVVSNYYSTAMYPMRARGVPTIEYSLYSDKALKITGGKSMRPDIVTHFINGDRKKLGRAIRNLLAKKTTTRKSTAISLSPEVVSVFCGNTVN